MKRFTPHSATEGLSFKRTDRKVRLTELTLLFVHSDDHHTLVATYADELVDGADASTRQFTQEDHALNVVVLQKAYIGAHLSDGAHIDHHHILHFWEPVLIEPTTEPWHH